MVPLGSCGTHRAGQAGSAPSPMSSQQGSQWAQSPRGRQREGPAAAPESPGHSMGEPACSDLHQLSTPHRPRLSVMPSPSPRHSHSPPRARGSTRPPRSRLAPGQRHNACCLPWSNLSMSRTELSGPKPGGCKETKTGPQVRRGPPSSLPLALWGPTHPQA